MNAGFSLVESNRLIDAFKETFQHTFTLVQPSKLIIWNFSHTLFNILVDFSRKFIHIWATAVPKSQATHCKVWQSEAEISYCLYSKQGKKAQCVSAVFSRVKNKLILFVSIKKPIDLDLFEGKYVSWVFAGMTFSFNYLTSDVKKEKKLGHLSFSVRVGGWP